MTTSTYLNHSVCTQESLKYVQVAFQAAGLDIDSVTLQSAVTALPSNFQPLGNTSYSAGLHIWAIVVIVIVGILVLLTIVFCCCSSCLCCCLR